MAFPEQRGLVVTGLGLTVSLCERIYGNLPVIVLCNSDCSVPRGHCCPMQQQGSSLSRSDVGGARLESSAHAWHNPQRTPMGGHA